MILALALFVLRIFFVDHVETTLAANNLAVRGAFFNRGSYFHCSFSIIVNVRVKLGGGHARWAQF